MFNITSMLKSVSAAALGPTSDGDDDMCEACGKRPKYRDFPYCGRSCGQSIRRGHTRCALPGCHTMARLYEPFCSDLHSREAGQFPRVPNRSKSPQSVWQPGAFGRSSTRGQTSPSHGLNALVELNRQGGTFRSVKDHFEKAWRLNGTQVTVDKIIEPGTSRDAFDRYRKSISGKEIVTYHAAQCICDFGVKNTALCKISSCGICTVVRSSFRSFAFGAPHNKGRFGDGIYSYENPALADRFATSCTSSPYRVMVVCQVAISRTYQGNSRGDLEEPVFVEKADAIIPSFVILYSKR